MNGKETRYEHEKLDNKIAKESMREVYRQAHGRGVKHSNHGSMKEHYYESTVTE